MPEHANDPDRVRALIDEAKQAALLCHANLIQVVDVAEVGSTVSVVLEFVPGIDLARLTKLFAAHERRLDLPECLHIVREILVALDYLHTATDSEGTALDLVHGDMAPANVMISVSGDIKLVDFGMLRTPSTPSAVSPVGGKIRYAAPERVQGGAIDVAGDLYATGLILWELLAGARIYEGMELEALVSAVGQASIPPVEIWRTELPPVVNAIVLRALAADPRRRFPTAADFLRALGSAEVVWDPAGSRKVLAALVRRLLEVAVEPVELPAANVSLERSLDDQLA